MRQTVHLVANGHIDPVWLWEWPEGRSGDRRRIPFSLLSDTTRQVTALKCAEDGDHQAARQKHGHEGFVLHMEAAMNRPPKGRKRVRPKGRVSQARCGLCGRTARLRRTECCGNWICDDEDQYVPFSYARNSCARNHRRYTLCGFHHTEGHSGNWKDCPECREAFETEIYVCYGTNEYNFEMLENPPDYQPTAFFRCGRVISLGTDGYTQRDQGYLCLPCSDKEFPDLARALGR